ncbi:TPA: RNA-splicing ligase RtcB [Candidatus Dependentiae bacterium]|nr:MAG: hypothetical protein US03_C0001G0110 [candidate division TM6 bacterium GW2011_GWF2_36_131]KKQ03754.1 MAG: hypothetical protein US13_C0001G0094 [candidate division TM6 bacterium GW2011_GWE2_36_25]KKQ19899.1 MAG: hypothetical protein US32_C0003G0016 [candidate division TM6 bacterium GW2011_GWA2_36_9]HBR70520.1 RNA-splicing ligase RtcB [Candidatus Dependentiae bacterium]HCU00764.1 RNA-splicing ligase RtcB [Candidatus Dependentiae bacterium]
MVISELSIRDLVQITENIFEIPKSFRHDMRVPARIFANKRILEDIAEDKSLSQLVNVATLPGIQEYALAMPDIHQGYGFPIGGVAAMSVDNGVISPGGIGYDINCGVRLLATELHLKDVKHDLEVLATHLFNAVPSGVGRGGLLELTMDKLNLILKNGASQMVKFGYGEESDLEYCEERGCLAIADPAKVSEQAKKRGADQVGTLGAGNHFLEVQHVEKIYDVTIAKTFGLFEGQLVIMIHCGSRGLGHQTCTDYVRKMVSKLDEWGINLPDRELACAPFKSPEGQDYFKAMAASANFAWANRHTIGHNVRNVFKKIFGKDTVVRTVYDVSHNMGKIETHLINGYEKKVVVHRKGATRAFGPGNSVLPAKYQPIGQPVLIPGTMGTSSYILAGTQEAMDISFGSTCHGAGRRLSRTSAKKMVGGSELRSQLEASGIILRCKSDRGLAEEAPIAYKDVDNVVRVVCEAGIAKKVAQVRPLAVIKG